MVTYPPRLQKTAPNRETRSVRKLLWSLVRVIGVVACAGGTVGAMQAPHGFGPALAFLGFFTALVAAYILRPDGRYGGS